MFFGEYPHQIDPKNRCIVPAKFRGALGERFILTKGFHKCLNIFTIGDWEKFLTKIIIPMSDESGQRFNRLFFSSVYECEQDGNGRVLIPAGLREYAGLDRDIVSIGVINRIEIWDKEEWKKYCADTDAVDNPSFIDGEMREKLNLLGI